MNVSAKLRYLRIAPRKIRLIADLIRGKSAKEAEVILNFTVKKAALPVSKLLKSAISSAKNNLQLQESNLYISKITVDEGPKYKRWMPRSRGQAFEIQKKTSHITLVLSEIKPGKVKKVKKTDKIKEPAMKESAEAEKLAGEEFEKKTGAGQVKPKPKAEPVRPKIERGLKRIFRRKSF